jgi:hypothetical protein
LLISMSAITSRSLRPKPWLRLLLLLPLLAAPLLLLLLLLL